MLSSLNTADSVGVCWVSIIILFCLFDLSTEHQAVLHQSGHALHHHPAGGEADRQPHHQQGDGEDRRPEAHQDGAHHQPLLQQQDRAGHRGAQEQVSRRLARPTKKLYDYCIVYYYI